MPVITMSRQFGAGGLTLGTRLGEMLGYTFINEEVINLISQKARVSKNWVKGIEKEAGGKLHQFINLLIPRGLVDRILDDQRGYIDEEIYIHLLDQVIRQLAEQDNCIILGRGGQYILKDHPSAFHILLIAQMDDRIRFMGTHYDLDTSQAKQVVNAEDKRRTNLYRKFEKSDYDLPLHYHLTLNMSKLTIESAAAIISRLVASHGS